ncbi:MAG: transglycosylase SLT domain-containing protein [Tannerella sp.]|jgi:membrane-bound lytic murein transglycosylase D|nr:transglycosylase SLT domain-containing protein [Tannerella sp.]
MKKYILVSIILILYSNIQIRGTTEWEDYETSETQEEIEQKLEALINYLQSKYHAEKLTDQQQLSIEPATEAEYQNRLKTLPYLVPMDYNHAVANSIGKYITRYRKPIEYLLSAAALYFPMIEQRLDKYNLPLELKYLAVVESALNTTAISRAGAAGLWQLMLPTARLYGLEINTLIDERLDAEKATDAACRLLRDLYKIYKDWNLTIAAYNCGAGNVNKAIRRSGGNKNFWEINQYLPKETRAYLPNFIATAYIMNYFASHNIRPVKITAPPQTDTVTVTHRISIDKIAVAIGMQTQEILSLNPQYKREIIPGDYKPMPLQLPINKIHAYITAEQQIISQNATETAPKGKSITKTAKITHTVKKGETLAQISNYYGVTTANIRKWNKIERKVRKISAGKKIILYVTTV